MREFGELVDIRFYGGGSKLNFPMGNAIAAFYWKLGYQDKTKISYAFE